MESVPPTSEIWRTPADPNSVSIPFLAVQSSMNDVNNMVERVGNVYKLVGCICESGGLTDVVHQLNFLVDLKQKQSNVMEARFTRKEAVALELTKASQKQARETAKQGKTIMVFTIVTITFVSCISGMGLFPATETDPDKASLVLHGCVLRHQHRRVPKKPGQPEHGICLKVHV